jgi:hypothetical protein
VFSSRVAWNSPGYINSALNKSNNEKPVNTNVHKEIHKDSYHDPSDHVDLLAPFDPQMAYCQQMRKFLDQFKS